MHTQSLLMKSANVSGSGPRIARLCGRLVTTWLSAPETWLKMKVERLSITIN
jgi:hypothetical protein